MGSPKFRTLNEEMNKKKQKKEVEEEGEFKNRKAQKAK